MVLSFSPSTPKLVNFPHFWTCTSLRKTCQHQKFEKTNMSTPKLVNFHHFWIPACVYIICIYVHMYITWFCYIWRVVVLSFIPSTPKLLNFLHFLDSRSWEKKHVINTKTSQFSPFLDSRSWEKTCIYICIYVNYFQPFPHILWVAQLPMGFHLAPTPVDARNAMFSHQTFVLCSILAPDFCKTRDMCIYLYIYMHVYSNPFQRRHCF